MGGPMIDFKPGGAKEEDVDQSILGSQNLLQGLQGQNGLQNQSDVYNQLGQVAAGQGPNPAQAMLQQATGQNVANQAALMASQRGAGANPALLARQAAQAGGAAQQQAANQGALLQAQQSLGALGQMGGIAGQQAGNLIGATQNQQNAMLNSIAQQNSINAKIAEQNAKTGGGMLGGLLQGVGGLASLIPGVAPVMGAIGLGSNILKGFGGGGGEASPGTAGISAPELDKLNPNQTFQKTPGQQGSGGGFSIFAEGGEVHQPLPPHLSDVASIYAPKMAQGGYAKGGGEIPGKPKYSGDTEKNDVVPAMLSKGEIVLPNSVTQSKDPAMAAAKFVAALKAKEGSGGKDAHSEFKAALAKAIKARKMNKGGKVEKEPGYLETEKELHWGKEKLEALEREMAEKEPGYLEEEKEEIRLADERERESEDERREREEDQRRDRKRKKS